MVKARTFTIIEKHGELPYTCIWTSIDGRLCSMHFESLPELVNQEQHLKFLGREPVLLLAINECKMGVVDEKKKRRKHGKVK